jgi:hypothetical protein
MALRKNNAQVIDRKGDKFLAFLLLKCIEIKTILIVRTGSHEDCDAYQSFMSVNFLFII